MYKESAYTSYVWNKIDWMNLPGPNLNEAENIIKEKLHPFNFFYPSEEDATNSPPFNYYVY